MKYCDQLRRRPYNVSNDVIIYRIEIVGSNLCLLTSTHRTPTKFYDVVKAYEETVRKRSEKNPMNAPQGHRYSSKPALHGLKIFLFQDTLIIAKELPIQLVDPTILQIRPHTILTN